MTPDQSDVVANLLFTILTTSVVSFALILAILGRVRKKIEELEKKL